MILMKVTFLMRKKIKYGHDIADDRCGGGVRVIITNSGDFSGSRIF